MVVLLKRIEREKALDYFNQAFTVLKQIGAQRETENHRK